MRVYLDICAIQRPFDSPTQPRIRLEAEAILTVLEMCEGGTLALVASAAHDIENLQNPYAERREYASRILSTAAHRVPSDPSVEERAARYAEAGLKRLDAFHLAAAVAAGADFFCTTDDLLLRRGRSLNTEPTEVVSPLDLILRLDSP